MNDEFVVGFMKDEPDGLTPIDIVMDVTGLTYDEVKSCCETFHLPEEPTIEEMEAMMNEASKKILAKAPAYKFKMVKVDEKEEIQEDDKDAWKDVYMSFNDGEGWIFFTERMSKHFTIQRKKL